jgi:argininosuccinate lyase
MDPALAALSGSLGQDLPLADADLRASAAYALALGRCGVLQPDDATRLATALEQMRADLASGQWTPRDAEDIHTAIEAEVTRRVGELGGRLHTGRSRNDQVATAFRLAARERAQDLIADVRGLQRVLVARAMEEIDTLLPAYTHLQRAQPVRLAHWLLAHFWPLERDAQRLTDAWRRADELPLGSGAATGHAFGVDREWLARELGFSRVTANSLDAVGDRDFAVESVFACALLATHLSRLAEELVIWSSAEFGFLGWPDSLATGSSLMPNKKNPDLAELVRARSATTIGDLVALLALLKGLPASYQRDLQEDKPPVWRATEAARLSLAAMRAALERVTFERARMSEALSDDLLATELADALVGRGVPFREAHQAVSALSVEARAAGIGWRELLRLRPGRTPAPLTPDEALKIDFGAAIERRTAAGGTARAAVLAQIDEARMRLDEAT